MTPAVPPIAIPQAGAEWSIPPIAPESGAAQSQPGTPDDFDSILTTAIDGLEATQDAAAEQARALATGQTQDISAVVSAVEEASLSMQLASQIRNKAVEAYTDIFHTQI